MKIIFSILFTLLFLNILLAQNTWSKGFEILPSDDETWDIVNIQNKLYLQVVGHCENGQVCSSLIEMDTNGHILNNYSLNQGNYGFDLYNSMIVDGNKIINFGVSSLVENVYNGTISSFDLNTKMFIHKKVSNSKGFFSPTNIIKWKGTNNYIAMGQYQTSYGEPDYTSCGITILDSMLNIIKDTILNTDFYHLVPTDLYQDSDSTFVYFVKGCKNLDCKKGNSLYSYRINKNAEIIKITYIGKTIMDSGGIWAYVEPTNDGNYLQTWRDTVEISFGLYQPYVCKLTPSGEELWRTTFKVDNIINFQKNINNMITLKNGDFLIMGFNWLKEINGNPSGRFVGWASRINKDGNILWERNYYTKVPNNIKEYDTYSIFYDGIEGEDGSIYMCGSLTDTIPNVKPTETNINNWVIKVGPDGCLNSGCSDSLVYVGTNEIMNLKKNLLQIAPNISNQIITANWNEAYTDTNHLIIRNIEGGLLKDIVVQGKTGQANIDINNLPSGMYFATIQGNGWQSMPVKFVKH